MTDDPRKTRERIETLLRKALTLTQKLPLSESVQEATAPYDPASSHYRVARYPYSRFYALYDGEDWSTKKAVSRHPIAPVVGTISPRLDLDEDVNHRKSVLLRRREGQQAE